MAGSGCGVRVPRGLTSRRGCRVRARCCTCGRVRGLMLAPDSGPQPDSDAINAGPGCVQDSILLARMDVGNETRGCGVDGLQRARGGEVVGTILEPHNQASSHSVEDDASTIAVLGELERCWFEVDARAAQHCDKLGDEVGIDSTRRWESRSGEHGRPDAVLSARRRLVAAAIDHEVQDYEDQGQPNDRETDIHHVPPCCGGLVPNITLIRGGSARRPPKLSARTLAIVASDPKHPSPSSWRRHVHPRRYSGRMILAIHFQNQVVGWGSWRNGASSLTTPG